MNLSDCWVFGKCGNHNITDLRQSLDSCQNNLVENCEIICNPVVTNFWQAFKTPIFALAPMEEVTDTVFRRLVRELSGQTPPEVLFTEFTSCEGIQSAGQARVIHRLRYHTDERPIVAQVWGITPEDYYQTAKLVVELGFDGMDINMGCPVKKIIKHGACSALIKNPTLAKEIVEASRQGLSSKIPLSIKTRIGFSKIQTEEWCGFLLSECRPDVLTVHGRTVKEESKVANHWEEIGKVVKLRDELQQTGTGYTKSESAKPGIKTNSRDTTLEQDTGSAQGSNPIPKTLIIGNGDILSRQQGQELIDQYNLDGVMIGRGVFQNPWLFNKDSSQQDGEIYLGKDLVDLNLRLDTLLKHVRMFEVEWGADKNFNVLKRFFKIYIHGVRGASQIRSELMQTSSYEEVYSLVSRIRRA